MDPNDDIDPNGDDDPNADEVSEEFVGINSFPTENRYSSYTYLISSIAKFLPNKLNLMQSNKMCFS